MLLAIHGRSAMDLWAASLGRHFAHCPNQMLYWTAIREAISRGLDTFDFGRSQWSTGTYRFKEQWGARAEPLHYQSLLGSAADVPSFASQRHRLDLAARVWKRLPLAVARVLGDRLYGVRLDTSETLVDKSVIPQMGTFKPTGVNPELVRNVRRALDAEGYSHVKIVVSGGFNIEKIRDFEEQRVPVDAYGVGSSLFQGRFDFTADVVMLEGKSCAKVGRGYRPNPRLERVV